ncbi:MAG: response regulator [Planctomycetaceae bacterium]|nr:response regulator [Planctomycetaceae bacterium]
MKQIDELRRQLEASRSYFHSVVTSSADGVVILTGTGTIAFLNAAAGKLLGRDADALLGEPFGLPVAPGEQAEIHLVQKDGTTRCVEMRTVETRWQDRPAFLATLRDITGYKLAAEKARNEVSQRDEFLAVLSHELRNPLAAISNAVGLLNSTGPVDSVRAAAQGVIDRQCRQLSRLLDDLLDLSRISQGKIRLKIETANLADLVRAGVETVQPQLTSRQHELICSLPEQPVLVEVDPTRITQVLSNILANAVRYTPVGGRIQIALSVEDDCAMVRVRDNGPGIPRELRASIFEPFVQAGANTGSTEEGLGIGLSLVRTLVGLHHGSVTAGAAEPGPGSEFLVQLPLASRQAETVETVVPEEEAESDGLRVLLVEDQKDIRETLALLLELEGHQVLACGDGCEAVEVAGTHVCDVALIDIGLPGLNGYEVAERIRRMPDGSQISLIALTGYGQPEDVQRAMQAGFDRHLIKPVNYQSLKRLLADSRSLPRDPAAGEPAAGEHSAGEATRTVSAGTAPAVCHR